MISLHFKEECRTRLLEDMTFVSHAEVGDVRSNFICNTGRKYSTCLASFKKPFGYLWLHQFLRCQPWVRLGVAYAYSDVMISPSPQRDLWWELFVPVQRFCGSLVLMGFYYNQRTEEREHMKKQHCKKLKYKSWKCNALSRKTFQNGSVLICSSFEWNTTFSVCLALFVPFGSSASSNTPALNTLTRFQACPNREIKECLKNLISVVYFPYQAI